MNLWCQRCGKAITEPKRRVYCSEACADVVAHEKRLERLGKGKVKARRTYRVYDYRNKEDSSGTTQGSD